MERSNFSSTHQSGEVMSITSIGIDLTKNVFPGHGVDEHGKPVLVRSRIKREALLELIANQALIFSRPRPLAATESVHTSYHTCQTKGGNS